MNIVLNIKIQKFFFFFLQRGIFEDEEVLGGVSPAPSPPDPSRGSEPLQLQGIHARNVTPHLHLYLDLHLGARGRVRGGRPVTSVGSGLFTLLCGRSGARGCGGGWSDDAHSC